MAPISLISPIQAMSNLLKNYLLQNKILNTKTEKTLLLFLAFNSMVFNYKGQVANYINNGSFENLKDCGPQIGYASKVKYWSSIDTNKAVFKTLNTCLTNVPNNEVGRYQFPRSGKGFVLN